MTIQSPQITRSILEFCSEIVDVLSDPIDNEGLLVLIGSFLQISGCSTGNVFTINNESSLEGSIDVSIINGVREIQHCEPHSYVAFRSMHTLETEFSAISKNGNIQYEYGFPLCVHGHSYGAISIFSTHDHLLSEDTVSALQSLADIAATIINQTHQVIQNKALALQLQTTLDNRFLLEQAKGILAERGNVDILSAYLELRTLARQEQRALHHVAHDIVCKYAVVSARNGASY